MSDKSYKYIGRGSYSGVIVLFYGSKFGRVIDGGSSRHKIGDIRDDWHEPNFKNITREYLTNTYGKCESQEHADFICKLAENAGFWVTNDYRNAWSWFCADGDHLEFYIEKDASSEGEKLIHLPLPPKESEMESKIPTASSGTEMPEVKPVKPIYTKEMHERGELPPVWSEVYVPHHGHAVVMLNKDERGFFCVMINGEYRLFNECAIKPIPTIEDELVELAADYFEDGYRHHCHQLVSELLTKYNITAK